MKRRQAIKVLALVMAFCTAFTSAAMAATLGNEVDGYSATAPGGAELARGVYWTGSDYRTENYIECLPSSDAFPVVVYGSKLTNYGSFSSMASLLENQGYHVIGGINGDYYVMSTYEPLGLVVTDGVLRSSDGGHWAVGFREDGSTIMGKPYMNMSITIAGESYPLTTVNKSPSSNGYSLFTSDYAPTTKANIKASYAVLSYTSEEDALTMDCELTLRVEEIITGEKAQSLAEGKLLLALPEAADEWRQQGIKSLFKGAELTVKITSSEGWSDVNYAVGSYQKLVTNGREESNLDATANPRTAIGLKADGTLVLYTIDGRKSGHSVGASMSLVAKRLIEMGCVEACLMDGGGSTSMNAIYLGENSINQINQPSDGKQRSVTNYIMLVTAAKQTGSASQLALYPLSTHALSGATVQFTLKAADSAGYAASLPSALSYSVEGDVGSVDENGLYTASGSGRGSVTVSRQGMSSSSVNVNVVETPDLITVKNEANKRIVTSLELGTGTVIELAANAAHNYVELISDDSCYTWLVTGDIGTIDATGKFTAGDKYAEGSIEVTAGKKTVSIPVKVGRQPGVFDDVPETESYYEAVKYVGEMGLFNGMTETEFGPYGEMTRAMFATVLWRLEGEPEVDADNIFTDVLADKWYTTAVIWANAEGVVEGYGGGIFGVNDSITREQMVTMLYRHAQSKGIDPGEADDSAWEKYTDFNTAFDYAVPALKWACNHSILAGEEESTLNPGGVALRHVVATAFMSYTLMESYPAEPPVVEPPVVEEPSEAGEIDGSNSGESIE